MQAEEAEGSLPQNLPAVAKGGGATGECSRLYRGFQRLGDRGIAIVFGSEQSGAARQCTAGDERGRANDPL
jgi:hypothetical protein